MQEEMKLQDYFRVIFVHIWKNKFLITAISLLFLLVGILVASWQTVTNTYYAKVTVYTVLGSTVQETTVASNVLTGYSDILTSKRVCERAASIIGDASIDADAIKNMITSSYNKSSTVMTILAYSNNPLVALKVVNAVSEAFVTEIQSITGNDRIQILDAAEDVRLSSNGMDGVMKIIILFTIIGLVGCILIIAVAVIFSDRIKTVEQCIDDEEEILGIIPYVEQVRVENN